MIKLFLLCCSFWFAFGEKTYKCYKTQPFEGDTVNLTIVRERACITSITVPAAPGCPTDGDQNMKITARRGRSVEEVNVEETRVPFDMLVTTAGQFLIYSVFCFADLCNDLSLFKRQDNIDKINLVVLSSDKKRFVSVEDTSVHKCRLVAIFERLSNDAGKVIVSRQRRHDDYKYDVLSSIGHLSELTNGKDIEEKITEKAAEQEETSKQADGLVKKEDRRNSKPKNVMDMFDINRKTTQSTKLEVGEVANAMGGERVGEEEERTEEDNKREIWGEVPNRISRINTAVNDVNENNNDDDREVSKTENPEGETGEEEGAEATSPRIPEAARGTNEKDWGILANSSTGPSDEAAVVADTTDAAPTTSAAPDTTAAPGTTVEPIETDAPSTSAAPTTTVESSTSAAPTTSDAPSTTAEPDVVSNDESTTTTPETTESTTTTAASTTAEGDAAEADAEVTSTTEETTTSSPEDPPIAPTVKQEEVVAPNESVTIPQGSVTNQEEEGKVPVTSTGPGPDSGVPTSVGNEDEDVEGSALNQKAEVAESQGAIKAVHEMKVKYHHLLMNILIGLLAGTVICSLLMSVTVWKMRSLAT